MARTTTWTPTVLTNREPGRASGRSAIVGHGMNETRPPGRLPRTLELYRKGFRGFAEWCASRGFRPLPVETDVFAAYLQELRTTTAATSVLGALRAIVAEHEAHGFQRPDWERPICAIRHELNKSKRLGPGRKDKLTPPQLARILSQSPATLLDARDLAAMAVLAACDLRRDELVRLEVRDVRWNSATSFTAQVWRRGRRVDRSATHRTLPKGTPLAADILRDWLSRSGITDGPLFRRVRRGGILGGEALDDGTIARIVKRHAKRFGLDDRMLSAESLRWMSERP